MKQISEEVCYQIRRRVSSSESEFAKNPIIGQINTKIWKPIWIEVGTKVLFVIKASLKNEIN